MNRARIPWLSPSAVRSALVAAVAATALSGCGTHPGSAAVVGDTSISVDQVDAAAGALCSANSAGDQTTGELSSRAARQAAMQFLIDSELSRQFAEDEGVEPDEGEVSATVAQSSAGIRALPEDQREDFRELLVGFRESELVLAEIGLLSLQEQGTAEPAPEEASAEGARLRAQWAEAIDVEVDPRFGTYAQGALSPTSGSLSIPVSAGARAGSAADPGASWIAGLPASQKCA